MREVDDKTPAEARNAFLSQLFQRQEVQWRQMASRLHDNVGQNLSVLKLNLENVLGKKRCDGYFYSEQRLEQMVDWVQQAIDEVRSIAMDLSPSTVEHIGLLATLDWFCRETELAHPEITLNRQVELKEQDIATGLKMNIFRVLQTVVESAVTAAGFRHMTIRLWRDQQGIQFGVESPVDFFNRQNGIAAQDDTAFGLQLIKARVCANGGKLTVESSSTSGLLLTALWPNCAALAWR